MDLLDLVDLVDNLVNVVNPDLLESLVNKVAQVHLV